MFDSLTAQYVRGWGRVGCSVTLCVGFSCWSQRAAADPPAGYYDTVDDANAATLRVTLHDVIDDHTRFPYTDSDTDTWDIIEAADEDPNNANNVLTIYRNRSQGKADHWSSSNAGGWSREHSWPKSFGFTRDGRCNYPFTDVHHLFASNNDYNSARSNLLYNWVPSPDAEYPIDSSSFSNWCWNCDAFQEGDWEVWPGRRGDVARAQMYTVSVAAVAVSTPTAMIPTLAPPTCARPTGHARTPRSIATMAMRARLTVALAERASTMRSTAMTAMPALRTVAILVPAA